MISCLCTLAGTQACKSCPSYIEVFGSDDLPRQLNGTELAFEDGIYRVIDGQMYKLIDGTSLEYGQAFSTFTIANNVATNK